MYALTERSLGWVIRLKKPSAELGHTSHKHISSLGGLMKLLNSVASGEGNFKYISFYTR